MHQICMPLKTTQTNKQITHPVVIYETVTGAQGHHKEVLLDSSSVVLGAIDGRLAVINSVVLLLCYITVPASCLWDE